MPGYIDGYKTGMRVAITSQVSPSQLVLGGINLVPDLGHTRPNTWVYMELMVSNSLGYNKYLAYKENALNGNIITLFFK
jgi:hypothetical protein